MKKLLALTFVVMVASGALAQDDVNMMGLFFTNDVNQIHANMPADPTLPHPDTNVNIMAPVNAFIVLLYPSLESVGGYEVGIALNGPGFILSVVGPNGWTNFGSSTNHLVGFQTPVPAGEYGMVLCVMNIFPQGTIEFGFGPSEPASIPGVPVIADGTNPENLLPCELTTPDGIVATLNGGGVVAVEERTLSSVKALFN
jgi:hypothetical protein